MTSRTCRRHQRLLHSANNASTGRSVGSEACAQAQQEVYIITLPVDGIQLQSLILTGTSGVGGTTSEPTGTTTLSYSPASSDVTPSDDVIKPADDVTVDVRPTADQSAGQKSACSGLDTLAAVADRLRQEMLEEEAAERGGEVDLNAKLDGLYIQMSNSWHRSCGCIFFILMGGAVFGT